VAESGSSEAIRARRPFSAGAPRSAIRIPKTAEVLASQIRTMIVRGEVREGDFLQPEAQLMEHFHTSRPTLREAFRILESEQLITVSRGSRHGAQVHAPNGGNIARYAGIALQAQGAMLSDIYLARLGLEPFAARLAAERRTDEQLKALNAQLDSVFDLLVRQGVGPEFRVAVVMLHQALVETAGSPTLAVISTMLQGVAEQHMAKYVSRADDPGRETEPNFARAGLRSFRKVLELIEARDADGAETHWRAHMQNANSLWLAGYDQTALVDVLD
jgi:DNA-binding FadR family transcriptional regulator